MRPATGRARSGGGIRGSRTRRRASGGGAPAVARPLPDALPPPAGRASRFGRPGQVADHPDQRPGAEEHPGRDDGELEVEGHGGPERRLGGGRRRDHLHERVVLDDVERSGHGLEEGQDPSGRPEPEAAARVEATPGQRHDVERDQGAVEADTLADGGALLGGPSALDDGQRTTAAPRTGQIDDRVPDARLGGRAPAHRHLLDAVVGVVGTDPEEHEDGRRDEEEEDGERESASPPVRLGRGGHLAHSAAASVAGPTSSWARHVEIEVVFVLNWINSA